MKNLLTDLKTHLISSLVLLFIFGFGAIAFYSSRFNLSRQLVIVLVISLAYVVWGICHHQQEKDLHFKIILEYFLIALVVDFLILSLLLRV